MATNRNSAALSTSLISLDNSTFPPPPKPPRRSLNNHGYSRNHSRGREGEEGGEDGGDRLLCSLQRHTATLPYFSTYSHCMPDSSSSYTSSNTYTPPSLPVIRIYGKTRLPFAAGVRRRRLQQEDDNDVAHHRIVNTVLHIHGVFPYCYIEYDDSGGRQSLDKGAYHVVCIDVGSINTFPHPTIH